MASYLPASKPSFSKLQDRVRCLAITRPEVALTACTTAGCNALQYSVEHNTLLSPTGCLPLLPQQKAKRRMQQQLATMPSSQHAHLERLAFPSLLCSANDALPASPQALTQSCTG